MTANAHQYLVQRVMHHLALSLSDRGISEEQVPLAPTAIEIVSGIMPEGNWLLFHDQVLLVTSVTREKEPFGSEYLRVQVEPDINGQRCKWCGDSYGTADAGGSHGLCKNCYRYGPSPIKTYK